MLSYLRGYYSKVTSINSCGSKCWQFCCCKCWSIYILSLHHLHCHLFWLLIITLIVVKNNLTALFDIRYIYENSIIWQLVPENRAAFGNDHFMTSKDKKRRIHVSKQREKFGKMFLFFVLLSIVSPAKSCGTVPHFKFLFSSTNNICPTNC